MVGESFIFEFMSSFTDSLFLSFKKFFKKIKFYYCCCCFKFIFFYIFKLFWYANIKNIFLKL